MMLPTLPPALPNVLAFRLIALDRKVAMRRARRQTPLDLAAFRALLTSQLGVQRGDALCIHSAYSGLNVALAPKQVLEVLLEAVGPNGTVVFPTFPKLASFEFLSRGETFDLQSTPSGMGVLTEVARSYPGARRSLHPTKSVVAIGRHAEALVKDHAACALSFDRLSPHYRLMEFDAKLIGLGVWTYNCSFVHVSDDALGGQLSVCPYETTLYQAPCIDAEGHRRIVPAFSHGRRIARDTATVPAYIRRHVDPSGMRDTMIAGRRFFIGSARALFDTMCATARRGITMYPFLAARGAAAEERQRWQAISAAMAQAEAA